MSYVLVAGDTPSTVWPSRGWQAFNYTALLVAQLVLVFLIGSRVGTLREVLCNPQLDRPSYWTRFYLCLVYCLSLVFIVLAGLLQFGVGTATIGACQAAIVVCILVYGLAKLCLYLFLNERAWIVHDSQGNGRKLRCESFAPSLKRMNAEQTPARFFLFNLVAIAMGPVLVVINLVGRHFYLDSESACHVGLNLAYSVPFLAWDVCITLYLTACFVKPLMFSSAFASYQLKRLAIVSLVCAIAALATSVANVSVLIVLRQEHTFICLSVCPLDIALNALILAATTREKYQADASLADADHQAPRSPSDALSRTRDEESKAQLPVLLDFEAMMEGQMIEAEKARRPSLMALTTSRLSQVFERTSTSSGPSSPWENLKLSPLEEAALAAPVVAVLPKEPAQSH